MKNQIVLIFLLSVVLVSGQNYRAYGDFSAYKALKCQQETSLEMQDCFMEVVDVLRKELERVNTIIVKNLDSDDTAQLAEKNMFIDSQKTYDAYENAVTALTYQQYIDGSIRNIASLEKNIDLLQDRINEVKNAYLHLFTKEIKEQDLLGKWELTNGNGLVYEFKAVADYFVFTTYVNGVEADTGTFKIEDGYLHLFDIEGTKQTS